MHRHHTPGALHEHLHQERTEAQHRGGARVGEDRNDRQGQHRTENDGVAAAEPLHLRFATLVPRGSLYHRTLLEVGEAWRRAEGAGAGVTVFTDGVQGDEIDLVRRMRIGQLNGAMISVVGVSF